MDDRVWSVLGQNPIFSGLDRAAAEKILNGRIHIITAAKGENIMDSGSAVHGLFTIISGKAEVYRNKEGKFLMTTFNAGSSFGMASMFLSDGDDFTTQIIARTPCEMIVIPEKDLCDIFSEYPDGLLAYVRILSDKIRYLNKKIDACTSPSVNKKLALFLLGKTDGDNRAVLDSGGMATVAKELNASRASVYRAFDYLESINAVRRDGKTITVLDIDKLSNIQE